MRKTNVPLCIVLSALSALSACHKANEKLYVALKDVPIYREPIDGTQDVIYTVKKGDVCFFGNEVTKKVYLFREVRCGNERGWTPDWMEFKEARK